MTERAVLDERRLRRALESQGFRIEKARNADSAAKILAPDGERSTAIHFSNTRDGNSGRRAYRNMIASLVRIGFDPDAEPTRNGDQAWKDERQEVDEMIEAEQLESEQLALAEDEEREAAAEHREKLERLGPKTRAVYDLIVAEPGLHPREYAERANISGAAASQHGMRLQKDGLVETTGGRATVRYWIAGEVGTPPAESAKMSQNGKPSAGPVRIRAVEPGDPILRYRKLADRAERLRRELDGVEVEMVEIFVRESEELRDARKRLRELEQIFGKAVDRL